MDLLKENIIKISEEIAQEQGFFPIEVVLKGDHRKRIVEVFIDAEKNLSADDLANVSRKINKAIEERDLIKGPYSLDISTPGVDRPLKFLKQFDKHINRNFDLIYKTVDGEKNIKAKLVGIEGDELTFNYNKNNFIVEFKNIIKAKVLISFS